jgi:hypothetical protein
VVSLRNYGTVLLRAARPTAGSAILARVVQRRYAEPLAYALLGDTQARRKYFNRFAALEFPEELEGEWLDVIPHRAS